MNRSHAGLLCIFFGLAAVFGAPSTRATEYHLLRQALANDDPAEPGFVVSGSIVTDGSHGSLSREQICDRLSALLGRKISLDQFNAWTAETNKNRMPADVLIGLAYILDCREAIEKLIAPLGWKISTRRDQALAELGRIQIDKEELAAREAAARQALKERS